MPRRTCASSSTRTSTAIAYYPERTRTGPLKIDSVTPLTIDVAELDGVRRVTATGELDLTTSPRLRDTVASALDGGQGVELDLGAVPFADSSALRCLLVLDQRARELGTDFTLLEPLPAQLRRVLDVTGLLARLPIARPIADSEA